MIVIPDDVCLKDKILHSSLEQLMLILFPEVAKVNTFCTQVEVQILMLN